MTSFDITFTLDTICPVSRSQFELTELSNTYFARLFIKIRGTDDLKWTYLAKRRLDIGPALQRFAESEANKNIKFVVKYAPYQLYPEAAQEPSDKKAFYKTTNYAQTESRFKMYSTYMKVLGVGVGIDFNFDGLIANTLHAHRMIQYYQEEKGPETADKIVDSLYKQYFEQEKSPSDDDTLLKAAMDAGITENEAKSFIKDKSDFLQDTKMAIREQAGNGVDSVPYIVIEGKRRDLTLIGAKEVEEYEKALDQIVKESK